MNEFTKIQLLPNLLRWIFSPLLLDTYSIRYVNAWFWSFLFISENCLQNCCNKHGLPTECLEEEQQNKNIAPFNATHRELRLVRSRKCHFFYGVMNKCKLECLDGSRDEKNVYGISGSNIKPMRKYKRPNKPTVLRFKEIAMAKGAKGKSQVMFCE